MAGNFGSMTKSYQTTRFFHSIFSVESENAISLPSTLLEKCSRGGRGQGGYNHFVPHGMWVNR